MKILLIMIAISFCLGPASLHGMSKKKSLVQEKAPQNRYPLQDEGGSVMADRLSKIIIAFTNKGWRLPEAIVLKHPREAQGQDVGMSGTNSLDTIYVGSGHEAWYAQEEIDFMLGHEVGHIALHNHRWLNPHRYMDIYLHPTTVFLGANLLNAAFWRTRRYLPKAGFFTLGAGYGFSIVKNSQGCTVDFDKDKKVVGRSYGSLLKLEEVACDLIAAVVLPHGGKYGASYMQKTLEIFGETDNPTHPRFETRMKWLKAIQWIQEHSVQRQS